MMGEGGIMMMEEGGEEETGSVSTVEMNGSKHLKELTQESDMAAIDHQTQHQYPIMWLTLPSGLSMTFPKMAQRG